LGKGEVQNLGCGGGLWGCKGGSLILTPVCNCHGGKKKRKRPPGDQENQPVSCENGMAAMVEDQRADQYTARICQKKKRRKTNDRQRRMLMAVIWNIKGCGGRKKKDTKLSTENKGKREG